MGWVQMQPWLLLLAAGLVYSTTTLSSIEGCQQRPFTTCHVTPWHQQLSKKPMWLLWAYKTARHTTLKPDSMKTFITLLSVTVAQASPPSTC
jgi:hypothetical protein